MHIQWCGSVYGSLLDRSSLTMTVKTSTWRSVLKRSKIRILLGWRVESDSGIVVQSSPQQHLQYNGNVLQIRLSTLLYGKQALPYCSTSHLTGESGFAKQQWIKLLQVWRKQLNKTSFFEQVACGKRGRMCIVPDTGNDNVPSRFTLNGLHSNCRFKTAWQP